MVATNLSRELLEMPANQTVTDRVEERRKAPGISQKRNVRLSWKIINVHNPEVSDLIPAGL
jgi:hypothetical protein